MKAELPVIANQHGAVKVLNNSVHTACHVLGVEMFKTSSNLFGRGQMGGGAWELFSDWNEVITR